MNEVTTIPAGNGKRKKPWLAERNRARAPFEASYTPEPNTGCWLWLGVLNHKGYGRVWRQTARGLESLAHRAAWEHFCGPIPNDLHVLHICDVRCCVNPAHLFLGDNDANMADMVVKGRAARLQGEKSPNAKLTETDIIAIRADRRPNTKIASGYGVSNVLISLIKRRKAWSHVA